MSNWIAEFDREFERIFGPTELVNPAYPARFRHIDRERNTLIYNLIRAKQRRTVYVFSHDAAVLKNMLESDTRIQVSEKHIQFDGRNWEGIVSTVANHGGRRFQVDGEIAVLEIAVRESSYRLVLIALQALVAEAERSTVPRLDENEVIRLYQDHRKQVLRTINEREGQAEFRREVLAAYEGKCAITGCDTEQALEAAHVFPYRGPASNRADNGLLLRCDIHTLFDKGLIHIDMEYRISLDITIRNGFYGQLHGQTLVLPSERNLWPSKRALEHRSTALRRRA